MSGLDCSICHDADLEEIGELESCDHCFCIRCILEWSNISNTCPLCKQRFTQVKHVRLDLSKLPAPDSEYLVQKYPGKTLRRHAISERNQVPSFDENGADFQDPLDSLVCMVCGGDHDEDLTMLCDGCNQGCHTYCADPPVEDLSEIGDWYCEACAPTLAPTLNRGRRSQSTRARQGQNGRGSSAGSTRPTTRATRASNGASQRSARAANRSRQAEAAQRGGRGRGGRPIVLSTDDEGDDDFDNSGGSSDDEDEPVLLEDERDDLISDLAQSIAGGVGQQRRGGARRLRQGAGPAQRGRGASNRNTTNQGTPRTAARTREIYEQVQAASRQAGLGMGRGGERGGATTTRNASAAGSSVAPTASHRAVDSLRQNWDAFRMGERGFGAPSRPLHASSDQSSSDDDPNEDMTLAERAAHARAKKVLEQKRAEQGSKGRKRGRDASAAEGVAGGKRQTTEAYSRQAPGRASVTSLFRAELAESSARGRAIRAPIGGAAARAGQEAAAKEAGRNVVATAGEAVGKPPARSQPGSGRAGFGRAKPLANTTPISLLTPTPEGTDDDLENVPLGRRRDLLAGPTSSSRATAPAAGHRWRQRADGDAARGNSKPGTKGTDVFDLSPDVEAALNEQLPTGDTDIVDRSRPMADGGGAAPMQQGESQGGWLEDGWDDDFAWPMDDADTPVAGNSSDPQSREQRPSPALPESAKGPGGLGSGREDPSSWRPPDLLNPAEGGNPMPGRSSRQATRHPTRGGEARQEAGNSDDSGLSSPASFGGRASRVRRDEGDGGPEHGGGRMGQTEKLRMKLRKERAAASVRAYLDQWCKSHHKLAKSTYKKIAQEVTHSVYKSKLVFGPGWEDAVGEACEKALRNSQTPAPGTARNA